MNIQELERKYAKLPQVTALAKELEKSSMTTIFLEGLLASSAPMLFGSLASKCSKRMLFIMQDAEEAGYFYHDLTQLMGTTNVLFFPSSYRRAIKYAQRDPASEILRTEVLARLNTSSDLSQGVFIVTYPEAVAELVVSKKTLDTRMLTLERNQAIAVSEIEKTLHEFGFREVDYVYEPGQFALRGSILDVYSFSCEYPYRIDFFGDDIDSIVTALDAIDWKGGKPHLFISKSTKGLGVGFMENVAKWHHGVPNAAQYEEALHDIDIRIANC